VSASNGLCIRRGNAENIIQTSIVRAIRYAKKRRFDTAATAMSKSRKTAKVPQDFIVDDDDVV
jgi:hypothetical protein